MEMQSKFARNMMAQKLMSENKDNPFNSRFFQPSDAMAAPTRQGFRNLLSRMEQRDKQGTDVFPALAIGSGFAPSAGISDVLGFAPDPFNPGQTLPSFSENIDRGNYLDAGLQTIGAGGDVMLAAAPFAPVLLAPAAAMKMTSQIGKALRGSSKATKAADEVKILDDAGSLARAREQGFDVDNPVYHGTNAEKLTEFRESSIGTATDEGFFGRGFYFASNAGEAGYYGKNVGKYVVKGKLLDLSNKTGDYTLGPVQFINWAKKLDKIDMLDVDTKAGLKGAKKLIKYFDENIEYKIGQNPDGTDGVFATIVNPTRKVDVYKGKEYPFTVDTRVDARGFFPKSKEEAKEQLLNGFAFEMRKNPYKEIDYFVGWNDDFYTSLSDYIRVGGKGSAELTKKAKAAGFDGVKAGDETVIFDPKNIRSIDAKFDPAKADSPDLLSSVDTQTTRFG
jgi:hypothetical protein